MMLLDKSLSLVAYPLGFSILLLFLAAALLALGRRQLATAMIAAASLFLWIMSTPLVSGLLMESLESQYPALEVAALPTAEAVIVLGGGVRPPTAENPYPDLGDGADRVIHALRILQAGKAGHIIVSGGVVFDTGYATSEAAAMASLLESLGVPGNLIIREDASRNTFENARNCAAIWRSGPKGDLLLVTSASHMPRALAAFRKQGLPVTPAVTDVSAGLYDVPFPLSVLPDATSLDRSTRAIKEWIGLWVYSWRGQA